MQQIDYSFLLESRLLGSILSHDHFSIHYPLTHIFIKLPVKRPRIWSVLSRYGGGGKLPGNEPSPIGVTAPNGRIDTVAREVIPLTPNDPYRGRSGPLTSKRYILYIYSTNIGTEYFKRGIYSPFFHFKMDFVS
jgi:hypothetical protein